MATVHSPPLRLSAYGKKNSPQWTCALSQSELRRDGPLPIILWGRIGCNTPDKDIRDLYAFFGAMK